MLNILQQFAEEARYTEIMRGPAAITFRSQSPTGFAVTGYSDFDEYLLRRTPFGAEFEVKDGETKLVNKAETTREELRKHSDEIVNWPGLESLKVYFGGAKKHSHSEGPVSLPDLDEPQNTFDLTEFKAWAEESEENAKLAEPVLKYIEENAIKPDRVAEEEAAVIEFHKVFGQGEDAKAELDRRSEEIAASYRK